MVQISPSLLACDFTRLGEEIQCVQQAGADMLHLDVMDGLFVPNISFGLPVIESIHRAFDAVLDVHLMIEAPERYLSRFLRAGANILTLHTEACHDIPRALTEIREAGCRAALSVKPMTPVDAVYPYLPLCDMVLVMTVEPGFGGQKLIPSTLQKVAELRREIGRRGLPVCIEVDGGIDPVTAPAAIDAGADILVAGSSVFRAADRAAAIAVLRGEASFSRENSQKG